MNLKLIPGEALELDRKAPAEDARTPMSDWQEERAMIGC
jgi:hypothetical protein